MSPWLIAGLALSVALLAATPYVWRRRGSVFALRWAAVAVLPAGLALAGLLTLFGRVGNAVTSFVARFVFSPTVWVGWSLLGAAVLVWVVAGAMQARGVGTTPARDETTSADTARRSPPRVVGRSTKQPGASSGAGAGDEFADIEEILRRRGI